MDGLHELVTPEPKDVKVKGTAYRLSPLTIRDWGRLERRAIEARPDQLAIVARLTAGCKPEHAEKLLEMAYRDAMRGQRVDAEELNSYLASAAGVAAQFWMMAGGDSAPMAEGAFVELVGSMNAQESIALQRAMAEVNHPTQPKPAGPSEG